MKAIENYDKVEALTGDYEVLPVGGYVCKILDAVITTSKKSGKEMLVINFDIIEGKYAGFYSRKYNEAKKNVQDPTQEVKWQGVYRQMLEGEKADGYFKGLITTLEASNPAFDWLSCNWDESKLKGLIFGGIFGKEEYEKINGEIGSATKIRYVRSVEKIRKGEFEIPQERKLKKESNPFEASSEFTPVEDDDLPF